MTRGKNSTYSIINFDEQPLSGEQHECNFRKLTANNETRFCSSNDQIQELKNSEENWIQETRIFW